MSQDISRYLADPRPGMTLDELARELNELAKIRENARLAFCKRLAVVYLMLVGHKPYRGARDTGKFIKWCSDKLRSATGKEYKQGTLSKYVWVGFAKNPQKAFDRMMADSARFNRVARQLADGTTQTLGSAVRRAVTTETPPRVIPITKLKQQGMPTDVAREVNVLMTAWEQASSQARSQFMYIVTGKRIAA